jgi:hypothetical protein
MDVICTRIPSYLYIIIFCRDDDTNRKNPKMPRHQQISRVGRALRVERGAFDAFGSMIGSCNCEGVLVNRAQK